MKTPEQHAALMRLANEKANEFLDKISAELSVEEASWVIMMIAAKFLSHVTAGTPADVAAFADVVEALLRETASTEETAS